VVGYNNKERIIKASRPSWYDLRTLQEGRGRAAILIPRLIYRTFMVVWNKAGYVPGELFIEFEPKAELRTDSEVYLAILSSSLTEFLLRARSQLYGGGTLTVSPGQIGDIPTIDISLLSDQQKGSLKNAYVDYLTDKSYHRATIDNAVYDILGLTQAMQQRLVDSLNDLVLLSTNSGKHQQDTISSSIGP